MVAEATPVPLHEAAGFRVIVDRDVTAPFRATCEAILEARRDLETELRGEEGDATFEEEQENKALMLKGISEGLLRRSLIVSAKP